MTRLTIRLADDLDHALTLEAKREQKSRSAVARQAIAEYLQRMGKERLLQSEATNNQESCL